ncbi:MAG TPA: FecR domain-containing protein, partial [Parasegetibacter sp.]
MQEEYFSISELLIKHFNGSATAAEELAVQEWINASASHQAFYLSLQDPNLLNARLKSFEQGMQSQNWEGFLKKIQGETVAGVPVTPSINRAPGRAKVRTIWRYAAAVVVVIALSTALFWWNQPSELPEKITTSSPVVPIEPGKDGAILTLADGSEVLLDSLPKGAIASRDGASISLEEGGITYKKPESETPINTFNTLRTPRSRQFQLTLSDGSVVWLNALSSVRFPSWFADTARRISITGEVYLEVASRSSSPFYVVINDELEIKVTGTSFNIHAYDDEETTVVSLLEGSIEIKNIKPGNPALPVLMRAGEEAIADRSGKITRHPGFQSDPIAWKNGFFNFNRSPVSEVMRHLTRWYDIE